MVACLIAPLAHMLMTPRPHRSCLSTTGGGIGKPVGQRSLADRATSFSFGPKLFRRLKRHEKTIRPGL